MGPDRDDVRLAFARIATNVAVVTTAGPHRCTASVWSEACAPPIFLVTLQRDSATHGATVAAGCFAVHVLADGQVPLARRFAEPRTRRFVDMAYHVGERGLPLLDGTPVVMECAVHAVHWFGAHDVVGRVESARVARDREPLLFADRQFRSAVPAPSPDHPARRS